MRPPSPSSGLFTLPKILFIRKDHQEEPFVRPNFHEFARIDSIDSDATAPNNPGPGRTIDLLFSAVGTKIERFLNQRATRRGLGPQTIIEDIRHLELVCFRREMSLWEATCESPEVPFTDQECNIIKRRCRKLLKHCRSHVLETQLEALEAITTLAVEVPYVRQVLAGALHRKYLIPEYKEPELYIRSYKALISVKENEVYDFFEYLKNHDHLLKRESDDPRECHLLNRFESFLRNPDVSFLLQRLIQYGCSGFEIRVFNIYIHVASTNPLVVEWETLRGCVYWLKLYISTFPIDDVVRLARHFPILHMYQSYDDRYTDPDPRKDGSLSLEEFANSCSSDVVSFLSCLCSSEDLATQLQFLREMDEATLRLFQGTVFNEIHIALAHVWHWHHRCLDHTRFTCLETAAIVLFRCYSCGHPKQKALAREAIAQSMKFCRYFRLALAAASQSDNVCGADMPLFKLLEGMPFERSSYCYGRNDLDRRSFQRNIDVLPSGEDMGMYKDDELYHETSFVDDFALTSWLEVRGDEYPFNVTGHFPVLAGFDTSGKRFYVARVGPSFRGIYSYVADGARSLPISDDVGEVRVFDRFFVMVLRHDPCDLGITNIPADAKLQTGPVFWRRDRDNGDIKVYEEDEWLSREAFRWADFLTGYAIKNFGHSRLPQISGDDRFEDMMEFDFEEAADLESNENTWEGLKAVDLDTDKDGVLERGNLKLQGEGSEDSDKMEEERGNSTSIEDEERQLEEKKWAFIRGIEEIEERQRELKALRLTTSQGSRVG